MTFEEWFYQTENFSLLAERFYEDLAQHQAGDEEIMVKWLKAAYDAGRESKAMFNIEKRRDLDSGFNPPFDPNL